MRIITFFAPGSGCGRTTAVLVTASAMLEAGKSVLVLEITDTGERPTRLQDWEDRMLNAVFDAERIMVAPVDDYDELARRLALAEKSNVDFVVVDTPGSTTELVQDALDRSTLVIFPVTGAMQAYFSGAALSKGLRSPVHVYGLVSDVEDADEEQSFRDGFLELPVLQTALPHRKLLQRQIKADDLFKRAWNREADLQARAAVRSLSEELMRLADEVAHRPPPPKRRDMSDPAVKANMLANLLDELERNVASSD